MPLGKSAKAGRSNQLGSSLDNDTFPEDVKPSSRYRLPPRLKRMLGRNDALAAIQLKLAAQKFVTIVGPAAQARLQSRLPLPMK